MDIGGDEPLIQYNISYPTQNTQILVVMRHSSIQYNIFYPNIKHVDIGGDETFINTVQHLLFEHPNTEHVDIGSDKTFSNRLQYNIFYPNI